MTPRLVGLVADDLTGATDAAVQFAAAGWSAHLLRDPGGADPGTAGPELGVHAPSLLAVVTGVRPLPDDVAAHRTASAVADLVARGCERLYLKIDSTLRGSVAGQLRGALTAWAVAHPRAAAVLCPAYPDQGRTVVDGQVLVGGVPVAHTAAAADPVTPVLDSRLEGLVPGSVLTTVRDLQARAGRGHGDRVGHPVVVVDARTDADLAAIAVSIDLFGPPWVAAGSAGLAAAMARQWSGAAYGALVADQPAANRPAADRPAADRPAARILVGVSSLHPIALSSVRRLREAMAARNVTPSVDVITTPASRADAATIAAGFGDTVAKHLAETRYDAVVLVGGDGAATALDRVGATAVTVHAELARGVPIGTLVGGAAHGVRVVTTSGGFGDSDSLVRIVDRLQSTTRDGKETP